MAAGARRRLLPHRSDTPGRFRRGRHRQALGDADVGLDQPHETDHAAVRRPRPEAVRRVLRHQDLPPEIEFRHADPQERSGTPVEPARREVDLGPLGLQQQHPEVPEILREDAHVDAVRDPGRAEAQAEGRVAQAEAEVRQVGLHAAPAAYHAAGHAPGQRRPLGIRSLRGSIQRSADPRGEVGLAHGGPAFEDVRDRLGQVGRALADEQPVARAGRAEILGPEGHVGIARDVGPGHEGGLARLDPAGVAPMGRQQRLQHVLVGVDRRAQARGFRRGPGRGREMGAGLPREDEPVAAVAQAGEEVRVGFDRHDPEAADTGQLAVVHAEAVGDVRLRARVHRTEGRRVDVGDSRLQRRRETGLVPQAAMLLTQHHEVRPVRSGAERMVDRLQGRGDLRVARPGVVPARQHRHVREGLAEASHRLVQGGGRLRVHVVEQPVLRPVERAELVADAGDGGVAGDEIGRHGPVRPRGSGAPRREAWPPAF